MRRFKFFLILCLAGTLATVVTPAKAGTFQGLEPGVSTKTDADRVLGSPIREVLRGERYDYDPRPLSARRISVEISRDTSRISQIDLYPQERYAAADYQNWLELAPPMRAETGADGNRIEYYPTSGISLHLDGPDENAGVQFFRHYDLSSVLSSANRRSATGSPQPQAPTIAGRPPVLQPGDRRTLEQYREHADQALKIGDLKSTKRLVEEGLDIYPNDGELWGLRTKYFFKAEDEPERRRQDEMLYSARRAYQLDPKVDHTADLGWIYFHVFHDCGAALHYFEQIEETTGSRNPNLFRYMGMCYEKLGDNQLAIHYNRRFLQAAPGDPEIPNVRDSIQELSN